jgi:hypothetical protein
MLLHDSDGAVVSLICNCNSFPFPALHRSNVQWQLLLRSTQTLMLTNRFVPSRSELSRVKKGEQTRVCAFLEMLAMKTSKGMRV